MSEVNELEELRTIWSEMSDKLDRQKQLTDQLILQMAHEKSSSRLQRIVTMEGVGIVAVALILLALFSRFYLLDNWLQITGGVFSALVLLISLIMGGRIIFQARRIDVSQNNYQQNLTYFKALKKTLRLYKRLSIVLNIFLPFFLLPVVFKLFFDRDLLTDLAAFGSALLAIALLVPPLLYLIIRYYGRQVTQVGKALEDSE